MTRRARVVTLIGGLMDGAPPPLDPVRAIADVVSADSPEALAVELAKADVLYVWNYRYAALGPLLATAPNLRWIHVAAVGIDPLLSPELLASDIVLTNSRGVFDAAIAEYVAGLILAHVKDFWGTRAAQRRREWRYRCTGRLAGKRAVVVGSGSIGRRIAHTLSLLDVEVVLVGRRASDDPQFGPILPSTVLVDAVQGADFLVLAAPLTNATRGLVDASVLTALGPSGYLINVGRGPLVVEADLVAALASGALSGAALDVFDIEPLPTESPLWSLPNVIVSPHMSGEYIGFEQDLVRSFAENLVRWNADQPLRNVVSPSLGYVPSS